MLNSIVVDDAVRALRPDFAVLLMTAEGLVPEVRIETRLIGPAE